MNSLASIFGADSFMPHGHCYYWKPEILWSYVVFDITIALAYYSIPIALIYFIKKREDIEFNWIFLLFSAFIFACGTTHLISIWTIWQPVYWFDVSVKGITALTSIVTSIMLWRLIPFALTIPGRQELSVKVDQLKYEITIRKKAEEELEKIKQTLEERVIARTAALMETNEKLAREIEVRNIAENALKEKK